MTQTGFDNNDLCREAQYRWLKPTEVHYILQNHRNFVLTQELPQKPKSGSLFLYNKRVLRFFRKDGHTWRRKEAHERLKVGNVEALNCYYAHGEDNPNFQRRSYWMLDRAYDHIVLVHYRDISEGIAYSGPTSQVSPAASSSLSQSPASYSIQNQASTPLSGDLHEHKNIPSPGSMEISSEAVTDYSGFNNFGGSNETTDFSGSANLGQALKRLKEQLSLNDDNFPDIGVLPSENGNANDSPILEYGTETAKQDQNGVSLNGPEYSVDDQYYDSYSGVLLGSNDLGLQKNEGGSEKCHNLSLGHGRFDGSKESDPWKDMLDSFKNSSVTQLQDDHLYAFTGNEKPLAYSGVGVPEEQKDEKWLNYNGSNVDKTSNSLPQIGNSELAAYSSAIDPRNTSSNYHTTFLGQGQIGMPLYANITIAQKQKFKIREISPEWGYSIEATKVIIIGSFLCDPSEYAWTCMFGDVEVPLQIIQDGVLQCEAPPHPPGKVSICITSGNGESCSEIREFEYRVATSNSRSLNTSKAENTRSTEEMLLLVRFIQILLSDPPKQTTGRIESGSRPVGLLRADDDSWGHIIESLLDGSKSSSSTIFWLLEELLKDKLQQWLSSRSHEQNQSGCSLSKKEQGIIHMVAGLGFEWALNPILNYGVNVNFRDINGWTALHWAARFGRENMVAALIASGAFPGAVTDPTRHDPVGKTAASIADASGHRGLAGYLSEVALTSHLSSLTLEESELSKGSAALQAELTVHNISRASLVHQSSLKDTLTAVRNAAQAAARIQSAFRAHSFRRRQQWEATVAAAAAAKAIDEYGVDAADIQGLPAMSKLMFGSGRDYNSAALSIQKKYRGWKGRRDFLAFRQKVVKIQAHIRGYQVRKQYKVTWAVGILEKVVLRWRRKGVGLRGFRPEIESIDESEEEDILKVFRKQKVDAAIDDAVSKVLSMVDSQEARHQYRRMLEKYRQAKAELGQTGEQTERPYRNDISDMENDLYLFQ